MACLLLIGSAMTLTSCGDDDGPTGTVIDYYLDVEEQFLIDGSTYRTDRYESPMTRMRDAIRAAYPEPNNVGNDDAVLAACDKEYASFVEMYSGTTVGHFTCLFHLVRATKSGTVVKQNEVLKTYVYDINPVEPEDEGGED